jgi:heptosyltransferase II
MTEPLLRRLQARGERITVGALPWVAPVYRAMPQVAEVVELPFAHGGLQLRERRQMARTLKGRFDVAYVCPNSLKSALLPLWAGIAKRVGYKGEGRIGLLTHRLPNPRKGERPPMVAFYSALSGDADVQADQPRLSVPPGLVADTLAWAKLQPQGFYVLAPGAEYGDAKRWPAEHFAQLAAQLDAPAVLLGSGKEAALTAQIAAQANAQQPGQVRDWAGRTTLDQALALIAAARAVVSNDSGLMHVAAALGVPQVAIFGSSSPLHTPPLSARAQVLWLKNDPHYQPALDCAPCFERSCPLGHTRCLRDITPQRVLQAL